MTSSKKSGYVGRHRTAGMPVRQWLHLGAASAGVGAALVGWSLMAGAGVANADGVEGPSTSAGPAASPSAAGVSGSAGTTSKASRGDSTSSGPSTGSRRAERTTADADANDGAVPSQVVSRSNRAAASESSSVADRLTNATNVSSRVAARSAAPAGNPFEAVVSAFTPRKAAPQPAAAPGAKVTWNFVYTDGAEQWTPEYRRELEQSAAVLSSYFQAPVPITITYEVKAGNGDDDDDDDDDAVNNGLLARAGSPSISKAPGFYNTVLQEKFISGLDLNGPEYDGDVEFNFEDNDWGLGYKIDDGDYDFVSTAMHELMHSLGFLSYTNEPGKNTKTNWSTYDRFLVDSRGDQPIGPDYRFDPAFNSALVGLAGMYFGGPNAVAAFGRPVPLWTPYPFADGTSMSHLDANVFAGPNVQMMNPDANKEGNDRRSLSRVEQGIMADLGYQVNFQAPAPYAPPAGY